MRRILAVVLLLGSFPAVAHADSGARAAHGVTVRWELDRTIGPPDPDKGISAITSTRLTVDVDGATQVVQQGPPEFARTVSVAIAADRTVLVRWTLEDMFEWGNLGLQLASAPAGQPLVVRTIAGQRSRWLPAVQTNRGLEIRWLQQTGRFAKLRTAVVSGPQITRRRTLAAVPEAADQVGELLVRRNAGGDQLIAWEDDRSEVTWVRVAAAGAAFGPRRRVGHGYVEHVALADDGAWVVRTDRTTTHGRI